MCIWFAILININHLDKNLSESAVFELASTVQLAHAKFLKIIYALYEFSFQDAINGFFPTDNEEFILYAPNTSYTYRIMENIRYRLEILEESEYSCPALNRFIYSP